MPKSFKPFDRNEVGSASDAIQNLFSLQRCGLLVLQASMPEHHKKEVGVNSESRNRLAGGFHP